MRVLGIDASNIRAGGGQTHLQQLIGAMSPEDAGFSRVVVWAGQATLAKLLQCEWLERRHVRLLDRALPWRVMWQQCVLPRALRKAGCDVLFSPGGTIPARVAMPVVTISQNLLPFDVKERARFGRASVMYWKLHMLRFVQSRSFRMADGVIFLTRYARDYVRARVVVRGEVLAPHGIETRFFVSPRMARVESEFGADSPFRLLYVSIIDVYKHQDAVARAVASLRQRGMAITVEFVGPAYPPALKQLKRTLRDLDPLGKFLRYCGAAAFEELHRIYREADAFVFASSCENLPNILLEAMASGLPIACSNRGPMPEVLGDAGVYFDPESPGEIVSALERLYREPQLRKELARRAYERATGFTWEKCARETITFIRDVAERKVV